MARHLDVWLLGAYVGALSQIDGRLTFAYAPGVNTPLSQSLPIRPEPFDDRASRPFFAGLLPEGDWRGCLTCRVASQEAGAARLLVYRGQRSRAFLKAGFTYVLWADVRS
jgi:HipA-like protein